MVLRPSKEVEIGIVGLLPRTFTPRAALILVFLQEIREGLVGWSTNVKASPVSKISIRSRERNLLIIHGTLYTRICQGLGGIIGGKVIFAGFCDHTD